MSKSKETRERAKAIVSPYFAWNAAVLKGGEMVLDSLAAAAKNARTVRVAVLDTEAPRRKPRKAKSAAKRAKKRRR